MAKLVLALALAPAAAFAPTAAPLPATMPVTTRPARAERPVLVVVEAGASSPALLRLTSVSRTSSKVVSRYGTSASTSFCAPTSTSGVQAGGWLHTRA